ncbi:MAG: type transport system permease protein [Chloroflexota bacterium]|jgi:ABC-type transport system involved in multi-copper enzyme maturation permease subunit|nr:type transport system permease protein [Chloroflexota bacterium]
MRVFVSGLRKLVGRPASFVTLGLLAGLLVLIIVATAAVSTRDPSPAAQARALVLVRFPGAYDLILQFILGLGGLFAVIYGAAIAGSEWGWGTLKNAVARGESRTRYLLLTFAAIAVMVAVGLAITFVVGIAAAIVGASIAGVPTTGLTDAATLNRMPAQFVRGWFAVVEEASLGFAIATLARSQLAGIGAGIAFYFGETFARLFLPDIVKYLPFAVAQASLDTSASGNLGGGPGGGGAAGITSLPPDTALLLVAAWLIGSLLVAVVYTERAEITG